MSIQDKFDKQLKKIEEDEKISPVIKNAQKEFNKLFNGKTYRNKLKEVAQWMSRNLEDDYSFEEFEMLNWKSGNGHLFRIYGPENDSMYSGETDREAWEVHFFLTRYHQDTDYEFDKSSYWSPSSEKITIKATKHRVLYDLNEYEFYRGGNFDEMLDRLVEEVTKHHKYYLSKNK